MGTESDPRTDAVLAQLGEHIRSEQKDDARFERVARGEASPDELAELERAASTDPELALRLEASRPLDAKVADRIATRLASASASASKSDKSVTRDEKQEAKVIRPTFGRRMIFLAGPLALAAALVLFITTQRGPTGPELPAYSITASGEQAMRGGSGAQPVEGTGRLRLSKPAASAKARERDNTARFELVLRPATAPVGKVVAYPFTIGDAPHDAAEPTPLDDVKVEIAKEGSVRITGPSHALDGAREIRIVIGAPAAIGKFDDALRWAKGGGSSDKTADAQIRVLSVVIDRE